MDVGFHGARGSAAVKGFDLFGGQVDDGVTGSLEEGDGLLDRTLNSVSMYS